jgi:hypothetical protein
MSTSQVDTEVNFTNNLKPGVRFPKVNRPNSSDFKMPSLSGVKTYFKADMVMTAIKIPD